MIKVYKNYQEFTLDNNDIKSLDECYQTLDCFSCDCFAIKVFDNNKQIIAIKNKDTNLLVFKDYELVDELVYHMVTLGLRFTKILTSNLIYNQFVLSYKKYYDCDFTILSNIDYCLGEIKFNKIKSCVLAGGCFWCMAKPYYYYEGINKVYSGYCGGKEVFPTYEEVKKQKTSHKETVKILYDSSKISYKEILKIYFDSIDPFDDEGQFIDKGQSYKTAIFTDDLIELELALQFINNIEKTFNQKVTVKLEKEKPFFMAEDYHQDFAVKNPELMEKELIESKRKK